MNEQQREALRNARDRIHEFNETCEADEYTDTGTAWEILGEAYNAIDALFTPTKPNGPFYACPDCGCTDVQMTAWVEMNTGEPMDDEGPLSDIYCPQCEDSYNRSCVTVDEPKPYKKPEESKA